MMRNLRFDAIWIGGQTTPVCKQGQASVAAQIENLADPQQ
jgi:hypothetical protein